VATPRGKIGRLATTLRDAVNAMIRDNREAEDIIGFLVSKGVEGVTPQNVSAWKANGYQEWLRRQERIEEIRQRVEFARDLTREGGADVQSDAASRLAVDAITAALEDFDPSSLRTMLSEKPAEFANLVKSLSSIRARDQAAVLLRQKVEDYERRVANLRALVDGKGSASKADVDGIFAEAYGVT